MANSQLKYYYFDGMGRGEGARLILAAAGKQYEEVRFSDEEWPKYKPLAPFGQCPILEVDGKFYGQSVAIKTYLAREFGFHGRTNLESLQIDQISLLVEDFFKLSAEALFSGDEITKSKAEEKLAEARPKFHDNLEKLLRGSNTGYFVGDRLTFADINVFDVFTGLLKKTIQVDDNHPLVKKNIELVRGDSRIGAYVAARKVTPW